ncbi:MAG: endonuclease/exonuclease/phosphatase family protein [Bacteroidetes bacterium]|nr:MAG: endonuclease/exonuclease/phosphatase family protein [Bacteroidota bacterium]
MKKVLKVILYLILVIVLIFAGLIITAIVTDYKPAETVEVFKSENTDVISDTLEFSIVNWNIGYCGLDASMDFFYDGGTHVRPPEENVKKSLNAVIDYLKDQENTDFFLLQEIDKKSKRSYRINQFDTLQNTFPTYHSFFGKNYDVFFVPTPPTEPYGKVVSGLMTISKYAPSEVVRHQFPGNYDFPTGLFMLDRCFLVSRIPVSNGKQLLMINTHNSAYDDGNLRTGQMEYLKKFLSDEYSKGNYIVIAGDWNQCPPGLKTEIPGFKFDNKDYMPIDENFMPADWKWIYQNNIPTNRRVIAPYNKSTTLTTIIDAFLISPNVENISIENINLEFEHSDHNPVKASFRLIK